MNISVKSVHFHADSKLELFVQKKLERLGKLFDRIQDIEVQLKLQDTGSRVKEKITEIRMRVPGGWLMDRRTNTTFEAAITESVDSLKRQVVKHKEKHYTPGRSELE